MCWFYGINDKLFISALKDKEWSLNDKATDDDIPMPKIIQTQPWDTRSLVLEKEWLGADSIPKFAYSSAGLELKEVRKDHTPIAQSATYEVYSFPLNQLKTVTLYQALYSASNGNTVGVTGNKPIVLCDNDFSHGSCIVAIGDNTCTGEFVNYNSDFNKWIQEPSFRKELLDTDTRWDVTNDVHMDKLDNIWITPQVISCREFDLLLTEGDKATHVSELSEDRYFHTYEVTRMNTQNNVHVVFVNCTVCVYAFGFEFECDDINKKCRHMCDNIYTQCQHVLTEVAKVAKEVTNAAVVTNAVIPKLVRSMLTGIDDSILPLLYSKTTDVKWCQQSSNRNYLYLVQLCFGYIDSIMTQLVGTRLDPNKAYDQQDFTYNIDTSHYKKGTGNQYTLKPFVSSSFQLADVKRLVIDVNGTVLSEDAAKLKKKMEQGVNAGVRTTQYKSTVLSMCKTLATPHAAQNSTSATNANMTGIYYPSQGSSQLNSTPSELTTGKLSVQCVLDCPNVQHVDFMSNGTDLLYFYDVLKSCAGTHANSGPENTILSKLGDKLGDKKQLGDMYGTFIGFLSSSTPADVYSQPHIEHSGEFREFKNSPLNKRCNTVKYAPYKGTLLESGQLAYNMIPLENTYDTVVQSGNHTGLCESDGGTKRTRSKRTPKRHRSKRTPKRRRSKRTPKRTRNQRRARRSTKRT